ncbi:Sir2 family NAD-dependent protein deacetylase [Chryseobacterium sp. BIGb0232]|uniref:Sir2 family NAD-dependent protein deacetylase n=1 Tax=Chryseobacterium sp. BIGb0232 TaxID=2940598 RepID=UPI000F46750A|nr:Sir2 family NAD-dependent protein deacetylase [Chryseobacterium sp. BIGb0232]MCS4304311.1 NAD-dependent deacetylase [Chryseobacterium sp. BIGb0232]ROS14196.1 NAD-dependent deacetylase [Chryseobacterium nakagawai]
MKKLTILSGAGISAESGIQTFRDGDGLWENHNVTDVASPEGWKKDRALVLEFYNQRRRQLHEVEANEAHKLVAELEKYFDVQIITQNIDDLHERAGSTKILHIHGELFKSCSCNNKKLIYEQKEDIKIGDKAEDGGQLRPFIVWFGEDVPLYQDAREIVKDSDILLVIGTSLQVYPAAGLIHDIKDDCLLIVINPNETDFGYGQRAVVMKETATQGMKLLFDKLVNLA